MKFKNNLTITTNEQIANYVRCHVSWVKRTKAKYFGSKSKNLTSEEKEKHQLYLNLVFSYQKIHSWKDVMMNMYQEQMEDIDPWKTNSCFKTNLKKYQRWIFFKWNEIQIDQYFEKTLVLRKSEKVRKNFIKFNGLVAAWLKTGKNDLEL